MSHKSFDILIAHLKHINHEVVQLKFVLQLLSIKQENTTTMQNNIPCRENKSKREDINAYWPSLSCVSAVIENLHYGTHCRPLVDR